MSDRQLVAAADRAMRIAKARADGRPVLATDDQRTGVGGTD